MDNMDSFLWLIVRLSGNNFRFSFFLETKYY